MFLEKPFLSGVLGRPDINHWGSQAEPAWHCVGASPGCVVSAGVSLLLCAPLFALELPIRVPQISGEGRPVENGVSPGVGGVPLGRSVQMPLGAQVGGGLQFQPRT